MSHALVIGVGNPLVGDDGAGSEVAARFEDRMGVVARIAHQLTPELAAEVAAADRVVFVDAAVGGDVVRVVVISPAAVASAVTHALSPQDVLALAVAAYGRVPPAFLVTVPGRQFEFGRGLSAASRRAIPAAVGAIERLLRESPQMSLKVPPSITQPA